MSVLFHQNLAVALLGSGSRGNCTYIGDGRHGVLVDCGLSTRQIFARLDALGLGGVPIDAVLVTHEHTDHVAAAGVLDRKLSADREQPVPFFMTAGTRECMNRNVMPGRVEIARGGEAFRVGAIRVEPLGVPHDTLEPLSYTVELGPTRVAVLTDLGRPTRAIEQRLGTVDVAVVEFNHDVRMLMEGSYPWQLKQRIRGPHGHLSNEQAGALVEYAATGRLRHLMLAHLSEENNRAAVAHEAAEAALRRGKHHRVAVHIGRQDEPVVVHHAVATQPIAPPTMPAHKSPPRARRAAPVPDAQCRLFDT